MTCEICGKAIITGQSIYEIEESVLFAHARCWWKPMDGYTDMQEAYDREKEHGL